MATNSSSVNRDGEPASLAEDRSSVIALNGWFLRSPATGTGQYLQELIRALRPLAEACGIQLALVAPQPDSGTRAAIARPRLGGKPGKVEFEHLTFPRAARRLGARVLHVPHFGPPLRPPLPTIVTIHDLIPIVLPEYRGSLAVRAYTRLAAAGARAARIILADSESSRRDIITHLGIPPERVKVVYLAAASRYAPASDEQVARVRAKYDLPERYVLYLGGFDVRKNVPMIVHAFSALPQEQADGWRLVIAGQLPEANSVFFPDPRRNAGPAVRFIGQVEEADKPALYAAAGAFVYPSLYEGFGLPPLEAMACGAPVLSSRTSSLPEVVGEAGLLLNPREIGEWVSGLNAVLGDRALRANLRARGLAQASRFSWDRTARSTLDVYLHLLAEADSPAA